VLIDCTLIEVRKNDIFSYDLNELKNSPDSPRRSSPPSADPNASGRPVPQGGERLAASYSDWQIHALLDVLPFRYEGRILAQPKLLVPNHHKGMVETKETTYVEVNPPILVPADANSQTPAAQTPSNYYPCEAGMTLAVTPHICAGDLLQLDIVFTRSDFSKSAAKKPPRTLFSRADTTATLPDGCTVILGGMQKLNSDQSVSKVPILGDLPLMGGLFRSGNNNEPSSTLYLFVKAEILGPAGEPPEGLDESTVLANQNRAAFEADELEFQTQDQ
jgi:general secretion pathway protein D